MTPPPTISTSATPASGRDASAGRAPRASRSRPRRDASQQGDRSPPPRSRRRRARARSARRRALRRRGRSRAPSSSAPAARSRTRASTSAAAAPTSRLRTLGRDDARSSRARPARTVSGVAPSRSSAFEPAESALVISPGTAKTSRPLLEREVGRDQRAAALARLDDDGGGAETGDDPVPRREAPRRRLDAGRVLRDDQARSPRSAARARGCAAG